MLVEDLLVVWVKEILEFMVLGKSKTFGIINWQDFLLEEKLANGVDFRVDFSELYFGLKYMP